MPPFKRIICLVSISLSALAILIGVASAGGPAPEKADELSALKFQYQRQGGLTCYAQITSTFQLAQMRQALVAVDAETPAYVLGDYRLSGRQDAVKMAIGRDGWALAYQLREVGVERLFDSTYPDYFMGMPEKAIREIAGMVDVTTTVNGYYDARYPDATGIVIHALYQTGNQDISSFITLPITNLYLDRGYAFFTAVSNSKFWLNDELVDEQGSIYNIVYRWGKLRGDQLRAGQPNKLRQSSLTFFGTGFISGVSVEYSGTITPTTAGGSGHRDFSLAYPPMLGAALAIQQAYIPIIVR